MTNLNMESHGGWGETAVVVVGRIAASLARHTGQQEAEALWHTWGRLSVTLQRANAQIFANRIPNHPLPPVDGVQ